MRLRKWDSGHADNLSKASKMHRCKTVLAGVISFEHLYLRDCNGKSHIAYDGNHLPLLVAYSPPGLLCRAVTPPKVPARIPHFRCQSFSVTSRHTNESL